MWPPLSISSCRANGSFARRSRERWMTRPRLRSRSRSAPFVLTAAIALATSAPAARAEPGDTRAARAGAPASQALGGAVLKDTHGASLPLSQLLAQHRFTVVVFYSATCPCFAAHVDRLQ